MTARVTTLKGASAGQYYVEELPRYYLEADGLLVRGGAADAQNARRFGDSQEVWESHIYIGPIRARMSREISNYFGGPSRFPMYAAACWSVAGIAWV